MDAESLRIAFTAWLGQHSSMKDDISLIECEQGRLHCVIKKVNVTLDLEQREVIHDSQSEIFEQWADVCSSMLETPIEDAEALQEFLSTAIQQLEEMEWSNYSSGDEDEDPAPCDSDQQPDIYSPPSQSATHIVFQHAREARDFLAASAEYSGVFEIVERPDLAGVRLKVLLSPLGFGAESCEKLEIIEDERILFSFNYRDSLLRATADIGWTASLFEEVEFRCTTELEMLSEGISIYFPGVVKIFLNRMADKYLREHDAAMGVAEGEEMLMSMGFALKDVRYALKKSNQITDVALEKLIKLAESREWMYTESPNPFINLCISLKTFLHSHTQYCRNCYKRHSFPSPVLRHCLKNSCALHRLNLDSSDNVVVKELQRNFDGLEVYLSFIAAVGEKGVKVCSEGLLPMVLRSSRELRHIKDTYHTDTEVLNYLRDIEYRGDDCYNFLRRVVQTNGLFLRPISTADIYNICPMLSLSSHKIKRVYEVKGSEAAEFQSEKLLYGSSLGLFGTYNSNWYSVITKGQTPSVHIQGRLANKGLWAVSNLQDALVYCARATIAEEWLPIAQASVAAVVEVVEKPGYRDGGQHVVDSWKHFAIRYLLFVDYLGTPVFERPPQPSYYSPPQAFFPKPEPPPVYHPQSIPSRPEPPLSHFRQAPPQFPPDLPPRVFPPQPPQGLIRTPPYGPPAREPFFQPPSFSVQRKPFEISSLSGPMKAEYNSLAANFERQYSQIFSRTVAEYFEIATCSTPRMTVHLITPNEFTMWEVGVEVSELGLSSSFVSQIPGEAKVLRFKLVFNSFFPLLPPFISVLRPCPSSRVTTADGFIFRPPMWAPGHSLKDHLIRIIAYISENSS